MMGWGAWRWPAGALAWAALGCALALSAPPVQRWLCSNVRRAVLGIAALAALASAAYVPLILRGGPRIIDATMYWLQSRILASGQLAFVTQGPASSYRGRFLLEISPGAFAGIFPPGYPSVLAVFQWLHAPWVLGPLLAALIALASAALAGRLAPASARAPAMVLAAALSLASGAMRYHTADTMAHGLVMAASAGALLCMLHETSRAWAPLCAGVCAGLVLTSRFASALALAPVLVWLAVVGRPLAWRRLLALAVGLLPFVLALGLYQHALTGSAWLTPQALYYARADAPAGCFRYGFGAGIGCSFEHAEFVRAQLPDHVYGAWGAVLTTLRRLRLHALDVANFEPLLALVVLGVVVVWRQLGRHGAWLLYPLLVVLAYAPFYFDGNYPGGGARLLSDALPLEHALIAVVLAAHARVGFAVASVAFLGFAVHAAPEHAKLRDRDGGRPMWSAEALATDRRLVFTNTDHGFDLGTDPRPNAAHVLARSRGDSNDRLVTDRLGLARLAYFDVQRGFTFTELLPARGVGWRFEGEHEWPARAVHAVTAVPVDSPAPCAPGRALAVSGDAADATLTTSLYLAASGRYRVHIVASSVRDTSAPLGVTFGGRTAPFELRAGACESIDLGAFDLRGGDQDVHWVVGREAFVLDAVEISAWPHGVSP